MSNEEEAAAALARRAHADQTDKAGAPYVEHLGRVAARVDPRHRAAAWLHDVIEDTPATAGSLAEAGFAAETIETVETLTRRAGERYADYIERVADSGNRAAIAIKRADLDDHLEQNPHAIGASLRQRYERARRRLAAAVDPSTSR